MPKKLLSLDPLQEGLLGDFENSYFSIGCPSYHPSLALSTLVLLSAVCLPEEENLKDSRSRRGCENWGKALGCFGRQG
ncbi:hypothetical protein IQ265_21465 [Nodosilinea sp. LEGE 06152]|uniref:hypothetical protein n=1 Tax=Nodosilinea sp. LEGE 06152 TaxID=2777966 RepID=UPI001880F857|nr:hypothetical protein [Nodosilinea sp. LEGE 06152]MBE9159376.1 hypothetical protein [Nodosilinea sp. LEGE 06152]